MRKIKIESGIPVPDYNMHGQLELIYAPIFSKMKKGDSIKCENDRELIKLYTYATKYSRRFKKNEWHFKTTRVNEYRIWRIA